MFDFMYVRVLCVLFPIERNCVDSLKCVQTTIISKEFDIAPPHNVSWPVVDSNPWLTQKECRNNRNRTNRHDDCLSRCCLPVDDKVVIWRMRERVEKAVKPTSFERAKTLQGHSLEDETPGNGVLHLARLGWQTEWIRRA